MNIEKETLKAVLEWIKAHQHSKLMGAREAISAIEEALAEPAPVQQPVVDDLLSEILAEVSRAMQKFPTWPTDPLHALAVLGEEFGELTKDVLQLTYEPHKTTRENVRAEALQTAAMALRFAVSLSDYKYMPSFQHAQDHSLFSQGGTK